jgi:hypothetical protein
MDWLTQALGLGKEIFKYLDHLNGTKYYDRLLLAEKDYYAELNKPPELLDDNRLSHLRIELELLLNTAGSQIGSAAIKAGSN